MASQIESIYDLLASSDFTPSHTTDTLPVRNIDDLQNILKPSDAPIRMLMVTIGDGGGDFEWLALGKLNTITWTITDRLHLRAANLGAGIKEWSGDIVRYIASYITQVRNNRSPTAQSHITNVRFEPGVFEWPAGSEQWYAGVDCVLEIEEVLSGA